MIYKGKLDPFRKTVSVHASDRSRVTVWVVENVARNFSANRKLWRCKTKTIMNLPLDWEKSFVFLEQFRFLGNCPPTSPLSQHFSLSEKLVLMFAYGWSSWAVSQKPNLIRFSYGYYFALSTIPGENAGTTYKANLPRRVLLKALNL